MNIKEFVLYIQFILIKMIILYYIIWLIPLHYIINFLEKEIRLRKLYLIMSDYTKLIFIVSNIECSCRKMSLYKCYKCRIPKLINLEDIDDLMKMLTLINSSRCNKCHLIIHTEGGECSAIDAVSRLLSERKCIINTYIPQYAYSAGTVLSISGNNIFMNWYSLLGPVDTQIGYDEEDTFPAKYVKEFKKKSWAKEKDYLRGLEAESVHNDDEHLLNMILKKNNNKDKIIKRLLNTKYSHDISYTRNDIKDMGLPVIDDVPEHIMTVFNIYNSIF